MTLHWLYNPFTDPSKNNVLCALRTDLMDKTKTYIHTCTE